MQASVVLCNKEYRLKSRIIFVGKPILYDLLA